MSKEKKNVQKSIDHLFMDRWSPRSFDSSKIIEISKIHQIFEAAKWAPSCFNDQPWRFIVCDKHTNEPAWKKLFEVIGEWNQGWCKNCQVLTLVCHDTLFDKNEKDNRWGGYDTGAATVSAIYQAQKLGIYSHQMGGFDAEAASLAFNIPNRYKPISVFAMGYLGDLNILDEKYKEAEESPSERKPASDTIFDGEWDSGLY